MFNAQMLADMRQQNIKEVNADDLVDIRTVSVDTSLPPEQRMMNYLEQVKNPYLFRCGDAVVSVRFSAGGTALDGLLKNYFSGLKRADFVGHVCYNHIVIIEDWRYLETRQKIF